MNCPWDAGPGSSARPPRACARSPPAEHLQAVGVQSPGGAGQVSVHAGRAVLTRYQRRGSSRGTTLSVCGWLLSSLAFSFVKTCLNAPCTLPPRSLSAAGQRCLGAQAAPFAALQLLLQAAVAAAIHTADARGRGHFRDRQCCMSVHIQVTPHRAFPWLRSLCSWPLSSRARKVTSGAHWLLTSAG